MTDIPTNVSAPARKLFWDFENQLKGVDITGDSVAEVTFEYDALSRRVTRTEGSTAVVFVQSGQQTIADYTRGAVASSIPIFRYVWGSYIDEPILRESADSTLHYFHHNQQYSTIALTNSSGLVVERYAYTAYGEMSILAPDGTPRSSSNFANRYTYTGREWDPSLALDFFRARWFDSNNGRFIQRDRDVYVDGASVYADYFLLDDVDPSGRQIIDGDLVCCGFDNGNTVWTESVRCRDGEKSASQCCKRRADDRWGRHWRVTIALDYPCDDLPDSAPDTMIDCQAKSDFLACLTCCSSVLDPYQWYHRPAVAVSGLRYPKCELPPGVRRFTWHPNYWETTSPWGGATRRIGTKIGNVCGIERKIARRTLGRVLVFTTIMEGCATWSILFTCTDICGNISKNHAAEFERVTGDSYWGWGRPKD